MHHPRAILAALLLGSAASASAFAATADSAAPAIWIRPETAAGNAPATGLSPEELAIWNDPDFKRRFAESYLAETEVEPRVTVPERDQMQKILPLIAANNMDQARQQLEKLRTDASSAVFDFTIANIYFQQDQLDEAVKNYDIAVKKHPKFRRAWRNLGLIHIRRKEYDKAIVAITRLLECGGGDAVSYGLLGFAYSSLENHLSAETAYRQAILLDAATMDWKMGLIRSLFKQERYADASALCGKMLAEHPERADLWLLQANAYIGLGKPMQAAENYEIVDRLGQSTVDSLSMLGDIYVNEELYDLAVGAYFRAIDKNPQAKPDRPMRAVKVLVSRNALEESRRLIEKMETAFGERLEPESRKELLKIRARLAVAAGKGEEEAKVLEEIVAIDPLDGEALILLGQHAARGGNAEKAVLYYERAASLERYEADAKVRHAQLLVGRGKYDEALPLLRRAQLVRPRDNIQQYLEQVERVAKAR